MTSADRVTFARGDDDQEWYMVVTPYEASMSGRGENSVGMTPTRRIMMQLLSYSFVIDNGGIDELRNGMIQYKGSNIFPLHCPDRNNQTTELSLFGKTPYKAVRGSSKAVHSSQAPSHKE